MYRMTKISLKAAFEEGCSIITFDNWKNIFSSYLDSVIDCSDNIPYLRARAARLLEVAYYEAYLENNKRAVDMKNDLYSLFDNRVRLPYFFYDKSEPIRIPGKPQPSFVESIDATLDRFEFIEKIKNIFKESIESIFIGGSMAYGPFLNIRDSQPASDIDLIIVVGDEFFRECNWRCITRSSLLFKDDRESFERHSLDFRHLLESGAADTLSHRFDAVGLSFDISAHFIPKSFFKLLYLERLGEDLNDNKDVNVIIRDFRTDPFEPLKLDRFALDGEVFRYDVPCEVYRNGFLVSLPGYFIRQRKWYQGIYHQIVQPQVVTVVDFSQNEMTLKEYYKIMKMRLNQEKTEFGEADFRNANTRTPILALDRYDYFPQIRRLTIG
ncbi:hypothetical protein TM7_0565 [candidate division TM7 genomosp. GTL1]|nr:hypothetical protein TM7_0565 [candidate division TM7 genomosp. GTL1]